jgi:hypothetical protein
MPDLPPFFFAILSWGIPRRFMRNILMSMPIWVAARRSDMYSSTVRLARPMAFPISLELRPAFLVYARRAVSLASSSVYCLGPMAFFAAYSRGSFPSRSFMNASTSAAPLICKRSICAPHQAGGICRACQGRTPLQLGQI